MAFAFVLLHVSHLMESSLSCGRAYLKLIYPGDYAEIRMNISLRQLRVFIAVARHGSFSRAADKIGLSQSATSLSVRELEDELGIKLMDRTTRHVRLTDLGESFLATASRLVGELDNALLDIKTTGEQRRGFVTISVTPSVAARLMPVVISKCAMLYPQVQIRLRDDAARDVRRKVEAGEVDFGVTSGHLAPTSVALFELFQDPFYLVCKVDHALAKRKIVRWTHLKGERLVMLDNTSGSRQLIERALGEAQVDMDVGLELSQPSSVIAMVQAGFGVSILPALACPTAETEGLTVRSLEAPSVHRKIFLARTIDRSLSPVAQAVWDILVELHGKVVVKSSRARSALG